MRSGRCHFGLEGKRLKWSGRRDSKSRSRVTTLHFLLLDLRANLRKFRGFRNSQACPSFSILLPMDAIPQEFGITGITPPSIVQFKACGTVATDRTSWALLWFPIRLRTDCSLTTDLSWISLSQVRDSISSLVLHRIPELCCENAAVHPRVDKIVNAATGPQH